ncbi:MAG TPA: hypothetical protein VFI47_29480, partial [Acidimicrobiales bacterium]|nr:hypothetical protein [Acidimicrobiales bacterium]
MLPLQIATRRPWRAPCPLGVVRREGGVQVGGELVGVALGGHGPIMPGTVPGAARCPNRVGGTAPGAISPTRSARRGGVALSASGNRG